MLTVLYVYLVLIIPMSWVAWCIDTTKKKLNHLFPTWQLACMYFMLGVTWPVWITSRLIVKLVR